MTQEGFESVAVFRERVREAVDDAVARRARRLTLVDPDFAAWPLDQQAWLEALTRFVQLPERRVVLIGSRFDGVQRANPRFVAWRRNWAHAVLALTPCEPGQELPTWLFADRSIGLRVLERVRWRGRVIGDGPELQRLADEIDAFAQRCEPTFPATTLGL
jgi:hypothetical protein